MIHARKRKTQLIEIIKQYCMAAHRFAPGQQEVDIYFPIRVSGRIKNIQQGVIAVKTGCCPKALEQDSSCE